MAGQGSFSAQVSEWVRQTKERQSEVFRAAAQRVVEVAQTPVGAGGNMPVDTNFLRASVQAGIGQVNFTAREKPAGVGRFSYDAGQVSLVIANSDIGDTITVMWTANYARHVEYGARGRPGRRFVGLAAQQWPQIVEQVAREAQARAGG